MNFTEYVKIREEKFGSVIFETLTEKVYVTNPTGADIVRLIKEGKDKDQIIKILSEIYDVDPEKINREVDFFIDQLKEKTLLAN